MEVLVGAVAPDPLGVLVAFGAGILSFFSPCVLPLVPGYVSMVSGFSAAELTATQASASGSGTVAVVTMRPMLRGIGLFIAGFTVVFVALGAVASGIGHLLASHREMLTHASGIVVILLGLFLLLGAVPGRYWSRLDVRPSTLGTWAAPVVGMAFAFAWTPCIGPVLAVVLGLAAHNGSLPGGVLLLFAYSLGLAVPFVAAGLAFGRLTSVIARARRGLWIVEVVGGLILVVFGVLLLTDHLGWISTQFQSLLDHIGLKRLSTS
jgi:cytochrome c-type biogenesis protein